CQKLNIIHYDSLSSIYCNYQPVLCVVCKINRCIQRLCSYHVAYMFENSRHFSYLSDLEREMTFRTEMGFYYSFFKTMNKAPTFLAGLFQILHDNQTEFGHTINDLKRFNVYPEVMLSAMYRIFQQVTKKLGIETETCWTTVRGEGAAPVLSCEGIGNPFYFYVNFVFVLAGSEASALFLYGLLLSDSILGGILTVATFFFNHSDATRIQWTPTLRESFGYPLFLWQMLLISYILNLLAAQVGTLLLSFFQAHIFDILKSKFTNFSTFHTRLYTCAAEFDFLEYKTLVDLSQSLLIPLNFLNKKLFFFYEVCFYFEEFSEGLNVRQRYIYSFCVLVLSLMAIKGRQNLQNQWSISGEYSNFPLERLFQWIVMNTKADDVFAGSMPLMANLKLSTERPIVIHPHYEDAELRDRVMKVYSVFSRKPLNEVYRLLKDLKVNYVIFESVWCKKSARPGCTMPELFDLHDVRNAGGIPSCDLLMSDNTDPFKLVYETDVYRVFKIA
ncbi:unnamed protein product, partial [Soboliphyme baturini]|uniref:Dpy-19 like 2 n=1 Tax=Soboliphyme baturini TaxID=241478 RepID=A0A183IGX8_9BILA